MIAMFHGTSGKLARCYLKLTITRPAQSMPKKNLLGCGLALWHSSDHAVHRVTFCEGQCTTSCWHPNCQTSTIASYGGDLDTLWSGPTFLVSPDPRQGEASQP
ncbi:hypothetical protein RRG08_030944 [Elysia crispata]|uniref:Uncharacterized protein n=1 Tax=Elysia crispata TaxID=231223 RepID=A0AAE1DWJ1_9GAST|nr:hypothetical protein RRG08_030944 [Elysia crispata]